MKAYGELVSSSLLEAELRSAFTREQVPFDSNLLSGLSWLLPNRSLGPELALDQRQLQVAKRLGFRTVP